MQHMIFVARLHYKYGMFQVRFVNLGRVFYKFILQKSIGNNNSKVIQNRIVFTKKLELTFD